MRYLLTNDDGIFAPGLMAMHAALAERGEVEVVAPDRVQSGGSHAITIRHPVVWKRLDVGGRFTGTSVEGTPADCMKLALGRLLPEKPDLVVSGINSGSNTGIHVIYSGTVAAAIEAAIFGCTAVAVSLQLYRDMDYARAASIAGRIIDEIVNRGLAPGRVYSINMPEFKLGWPLGVRIAPQSTSWIKERIEQRHDPNGREYYWLSGDFLNIGDESGTDRFALSEGYVCVTPLQFNLTDSAMMEAMSTWSWPSIE